MGWVGCMLTKIVDAYHRNNTLIKRIPRTNWGREGMGGRYF